MSRVARIVVPGFPHHITQRGNRQMDVFETDYAYCLMTNHIHLVVVPGDEVALGKALRDTHTVYAMYFNTCTALSGHVWQGRWTKRLSPFSPTQFEPGNGKRASHETTMPHRT